MTFALTLTFWMLVGPGTELLVDVAGDRFAPDVAIDRASEYARVVVVAKRKDSATCRIIRGPWRGMKTVFSRELWLGSARVLKLVPPGCDRGL